jgi:CO/xanthine dehydrogenase Mo-binding subunit
MFFEGFDIYIAASVLGATYKTGFSTLAQNGLFISMIFVGMTLGALLTGFLGDRYGRRFTYQLNLIIFGAAALTSAVAPAVSHGLGARGRGRGRIFHNGGVLPGGNPRTMVGHDVYGRHSGTAGFFARFKNTGSYCAVVASVSVEETVEVHKLWAAVAAGLVINPAGVVSQIEGGMLQAASWVLKEAVPTDGTRLVAESWKDYPILSFAETPETNVEIIAGPEIPSTGVGEVSLGPTAGAIANVVANALGMRARDLPLTRERLMKAALEAE